METGIDSPMDCSKRIDAITAANLAFVGRYYRKRTSKWAPLTAAEAKLLSDAGVNTVALWEASSDHLSYFSYTAGVDDGTSAYAQAMGVGQPASTPIYFAVDFDAAQNEIAGAINDYFAGIAAGFAAISHGSPVYDVGVYGSGASCAWLLAHNRVSKSWLALSSGWSGSKLFNDWNIKQGTGLSTLNFDNDSDQAKPDYGGFRVQ
jgi:hypothetical protein